MQQFSCRKRLVLGLMAIAISLFTGCSYFEKPDVQSFYGQALGTSYSVKFVGLPSDVNSYQRGTDAALDRVNSAMSTYLKQSELNQLNDAPPGKTVKVSPELFEVLSMAMDVSRKTGGAFDVTVKPLVDLWGFGPKGRPDVVPAADALEKAHAELGYEAIHLDPENRTVTKTAQRELDLSAIAKGYAVDKIADYFDAQGVKSYLVEVGGEMRLRGTKEGNEPWRVAIETPDSSARGVYRILPLTDKAIATSGDYRNYFEVNGKRYSHTIDPETGYPITHQLASASVVTERCAIADAWATAMMVLGVDKAMNMAKKEDLAVFLIQKTPQGFKAYASDDFKVLNAEEGDHS